MDKDEEEIRQRPDGDPIAAALDDCSTVEAFHFLSPTIRLSWK